MNNENYGIVHALAFCESCNWTDGLIPRQKNRVSALRQRAKNHAKKHNHTVSVETGSIIKYNVK